MHTDRAEIKKLSQSASSVLIRVPFYFLSPELFKKGNCIAISSQRF